MKNAKSLALIASGLLALSASPGTAQVNGIATSTPEAVFVRAAARQAAYQQINQTYGQQIQQIRSLQQQNQQAQQSLDTDGDNQISQAELQAGQATVQQIQQREQQIAQIGQPIALAQTYAIEQLANEYANARQQVISNRNIQLMLSPEAIQYAPEGIDVTDQIIATLDQRVPTVQIQPPAGWQPRRESLALQQAVQQILLGVAQQQAIQQAQQQAQQQGQQPQGR
jgi:Skp family chaperone for outer membrane proteins